MTQLLEQAIAKVKDQDAIAAMILEELKDRSLLREIAKGRKEYQKGGWISVSQRRKKLK